MAASVGVEAGWTCSNGWIDRWKERHGIVYKTRSGERASVDEEKTDKWVNEVLLPTIEKYEEKDIFNADETGLFWRLLPDKTHTFKHVRCSGGKKSEDRVTVLLCCNMDSSEKIRPLAIGKHGKPRCFQRVKKLPVDYKANPSAWMTNGIFCEWLLAFDRDMLLQHRKVLLVLDNCSTHEIPELSHLKAVQVLFLPANSTAKLQPCDAGVICNLKVHYRRMMVFSMLAHISDGDGKATEQRAELNLLDALKRLEQSWQKVTPATISNSFRHAGFKTMAPNDRPQGPESASPLGFEEPEPESASPLGFEEPEPESASPLGFEEPEPESASPLGFEEPEPESASTLGYEEPEHLPARLFKEWDISHTDYITWRRRVQQHSQQLLQLLRHQTFVKQLPRKHLRRMTTAKKKQKGFPLKKCWVV